MSRRARSARGDIVDFDIIAIKEQLALKPVPVAVDQRRKFIDEKDGIKTKEIIPALPSALSLAVEAVETSAVAAPVAKPVEPPKAAVKPVEAPKATAPAKPVEPPKAVVPTEAAAK